MQARPRGANESFTTSVSPISVEENVVEDIGGELEEEEEGGERMGETADRFEAEEER